MNLLAGRIRLNFRADDPIYLQIARQVEELLADGTIKPGDQLPTVRELAIDLRINFSTVARAYRILDERRIISTQRGRGTYIEDEAAPQPTPQPGQLDARLAALAQTYIREAAGLGAGAEQIAQALHDQLGEWRRGRPDAPGSQ